VFSCRIYVYHMYVFYFSDKYVAFKSFLCVCLSSVCCFLIDLICVYLSYTCMCAQSGRWFHAGYIVAHTSQAQFLGLADSTTLFGGANGTATRLQYKPDNVCVYCVRIYIRTYIHALFSGANGTASCLQYKPDDVCVCVCVYICTYIYLYTYVYACIYICEYIYIKNIHICICICMYMYASHSSKYAHVWYYYCKFSAQTPCNTSNQSRKLGPPRCFGRSHRQNKGATRRP